VSTNGTSIPIYNRAMTTLSLATNPTVSNFSAVTEKALNGSPSVANAMVSTTYYSGDQVGSAQIVTAGSGWPVASCTYYPFGAEATQSADSNHYKFTVRERDQESGLDYFGARYYASSMGRFMPPDGLWSGTGGGSSAQVALNS
jgi:RHS repeat-associated protein